MAPAAGHGQGAGLSAAGRRQPLQVPAASSQGGRAQDTSGDTGVRPDPWRACAQRRVRRAACPRAPTRHGCVAWPPPSPARSAGAPLLRRHVRGADRGDDGDQPGCGEEPRLAGHRRPAPNDGVFVMSPHDRYDDFDELLRSALRDEADTITPAGDGLSRIQQRVQQRGFRQRWMRPALALGSVAALAVIGIGAAVLVNSSGDDKVGISDSPSPEPTDTATTAPVVASDFPNLAIFPFTTATAEDGWEQDYANGGTTWEADPSQVATHWVQDFLDQPSVDRVVDTTDDGNDKLVTLGRVLQAESHPLFKVTTVRLTPYNNAWIVTGASDPNGFMSISSPDP